MRHRVMAVAGWVRMRTARAALIAGATTAGLLALGPAPAAAQTANCRTTGNFNTWLADFKKEALAQGISPAAIAAASPYLVYDQRIVNIDRGQRFFSQTFLEFSDRMLPAYRLQQGAAEIRKWQPVFQREEKEFGVPAAVITGFWGLESDFGGGQGKDNALKSLTTLAYDCRRSDMFRGHLFDALRMIERGDLRPEEMIGSWAGELGQTQMMPSEYYRDAVDYDGTGKRNLIKSVPDVIGSTGKYLVYLGWKRGEPWLQEVRAPANTPWQEADLSIQHPRAQWAAWGVTLADGRPLPSDKLPASLVLPMGRFGPAFLAYDNFQVYLKWNQSLTYALTAAYYATRLEGAPAMHRGGDIPKLSFDETRELQLILEKRGYDIGRTDGILGLKSRSAVREMQVKLGLPADSWPTTELLARLRQGR
ncbi:MAG TPA: lytic murein transglycosylase [Xanthobacteraceae bacterium]|nr:lytic murein transglycosylase [Xanthobacteraceae bacterium]